MVYQIIMEQIVDLVMEGFDPKMLNAVKYNTEVFVIGMTKTHGLWWRW